MKKDFFNSSSGFSLKNHMTGEVRRIEGCTFPIKGDDLKEIIFQALMDFPPLDDPQLNYVGRNISGFKVIFGNTLVEGDYCFDKKHISQHKTAHLISTEIFNSYQATNSFKHPNSNYEDTVQLAVLLDEFKTQNSSFLGSSCLIM